MLFKSVGIIALSVVGFGYITSTTAITYFIIRRKYKDRSNPKIILGSLGIITTPIILLYGVGATLGIASLCFLDQFIIPVLKMEYY